MKLAVLAGRPAIGNVVARQPRAARGLEPIILAPDVTERSSCSRGPSIGEDDAFPACDRWATRRMHITISVDTLTSGPSAAAAAAADTSCR